MKILFIGDIVGQIGRRIVEAKLPYYVDKYGIDFVIANGENATHGKGLIFNHYQELINDGVDVITLGNHYDSKNEIRKYIDRVDRLIRPINLKKTYPGEGTIVFDFDNITIRITNVLGNVFIQEEVVQPYISVKELIDSSDKCNIHIVDFHGEATSEKICFANAFDGQLTAVIGTHTHVQTKDCRILKNGTGFISDVGMCGLYDGVLGFEKQSVINKAVYGMNSKFEVPSEGEGVFSAVVIDVDENSGLTKNIFPIYFVEGSENEK